MKERPKWMDDIEHFINLIDDHPAIIVIVIIAILIGC